MKALGKGHRYGLSSAIAWVMLGIVSACSSGQTEDAGLPLLQAVIRSDTGLFRGLSFQTPISAIAKAEGQAPIHADDLGLVYLYRLPKDGRLEIEYYRLASDTTLLLSIIANVFLSDEATTQTLYRDLLNHLTRQYDREPEGAFGDYVFSSAKRYEVAYLRLHPNKTSLTLNLTRPKAQ